MAEDWQHPTLHSEMHRRRRAKGDGVPPANRPIQCPRCGHRNIPLDMLTDVRGLTPEQREQFGLADDDTFICDACRELIHGLGNATHGELAAALGAPADVLERFAEHDRAFPYPGDSPAHERRRALHGEDGDDLEVPPALGVAPRPFRDGALDRKGRRP